MWKRILRYVKWLVITLLRASSSSLLFLSTDFAVAPPPSSSARKAAVLAFSYSSLRAMKACLDLRRFTSHSIWTQTNTLAYSSIPISLSLCTKQVYQFSLCSNPVLLDLLTSLFVFLSTLEQRLHRRRVSKGVQQPWEESPSHPMKLQQRLPGRRSGCAGLCWPAADPHSAPGPAPEPESRWRRGACGAATHTKHTLGSSLFWIVTSDRWCEIIYMGYVVFAGLV